VYCVFGLSNASGICAQLVAQQRYVVLHQDEIGSKGRVTIQAGKKSSSSRKKTSLSLLAIQKLFASVSEVGSALKQRVILDAAVDFFRAITNFGHSLVKVR